MTSEPAHGGLSVSNEYRGVLEQLLESQRLQLTELRLLRELLEQIRDGLCPTAKAPKTLEKLLPTIARAMGDTAAFTSREIVLRARTDGRLRAALEAAVGDIEDNGIARKVGDILGRGVGTTHGALRVARVKDEATGVLWTIERPMVASGGGRDATTTDNSTKGPGRVPMEVKTNSGIDE